MSLALFNYNECVVNVLSHGKGSERGRWVWSAIVIVIVQGREIW